MGVHGAYLYVWKKSDKILNWVVTTDAKNTMLNWPFEEKISESPKHNVYPRLAKENVRINLSI